MPIAVPVASGSTTKPRVLFIGHTSGLEEHDRRIREVAEVHCISGRNYEESIPLIKEMVDSHGPFVAFGVSSDICLCTARLEWGDGIWLMSRGCS